jgi:hypothetical protein
VPPPSPVHGWDQNPNAQASGHEQPARTCCPLANPQQRVHAMESPESTPSTSPLESQSIRGVSL